MAKLVMSDKQMAKSPDILSKFSCCATVKWPFAPLKEIYKDEAQHVAHDITTRLCALPLQPAVAADFRGPSHWTIMMSLFSSSIPGTPTRNRTNRACC